MCLNRSTPTNRLANPFDPHRLFLAGEIEKELVDPVVQLGSAFGDDEDDQALLEKILLKATKRGDGAETYLQEMWKLHSEDSAALPINAITTIAKLAKDKHTVKKVFAAILERKNDSDLEEAVRVV